MSAEIKFDDADPIGIAIVDRKPGIIRGGETRAEHISFTCVKPIDRLLPALLRDEVGTIYEFTPITSSFAHLGETEYSGYIVPAKRRV